MNDFPDDPEDDLFFEPETRLEADAPQRFWTRRRIFLTIMAIIIVITLLAYMFSGLFIPPPPPPTAAPGSMI